MFLPFPETLDQTYTNNLSNFSFFPFHLLPPQNKPPYTLKKDHLYILFPNIRSTYISHKVFFKTSALNQNEKISKTEKLQDIEKYWRTTTFCLTKSLLPVNNLIYITIVLFFWNKTGTKKKRYLTTIYWRIDVFKKINPTLKGQHIFIDT